MKVGILTFHCAYNFGAVLQCYALFSTVKSLGYDVKVIDYRPGYLASNRENFHWYTFINKTPWENISRIRAIIKCRKHYDLFDSFIRNYISLSNACCTKDQLNQVVEDFDAIIVGSDQVWCDKYIGRDVSWFGFDTKNDTKWIGYAVSAGNSSYKSSELGKLINRFSSIGTRELDLYEQIKVSYGGLLDNVLDPTLLVAPDVWNSWCAPIIRGDYILAYQARECDDVFRIAGEISKQIGVKKIIPVDFYPNVSRMGYSTYVCSPPEFVSLVKNARCVITTSFHGSAFSIINGTPFYAIKLNDGADGRTQHLLDSVGLSDRFIEPSTVATFSDYNAPLVFDRLNQLRERSLSFLKKSLK